MIPGITAAILAVPPAAPVLGASFIDWPINVADLSQSLQVTGGVGPFTYAIVSGSLPTGLSLNASTGAITGTPTVGGLASFTARVTDFLGRTSDLATGITIEQDASWASVKMLAGFNGANNATTYTSEDTGARTATFVGNAKLSTAQAMFGSASALFDGAGDIITFPDSGDWTLGSADFTIEAWVRMSAAGAGNTTMVAHYSATSNQRGWSFVASSSRIPAVNLSPNGSSLNGYGFGTGNTLTLNQWHHVAICRTGGVLYGFIDGAQIINPAEATTIFNSTAALSIGAVLTGGGADYWNGYIDEVRITTGVARYTSAFTPRSLPFPRG